LRSLRKYHGKPGCGAGVEFKIKEGPITMLSINSTYDGKFKFIIAEGESVEGPIPPTGNTNTRGYFKPDIRTFLKNWISEGPTHHFALGIGHHANTIAKIASYLNIESKIV
jgi:L-arabinose isomerase